MAVKPGTTVRELGTLPGTFKLNKKLSDGDDKMLELQGIGWAMRQAIKVSGVTLNIHSKTDDQGVFHLDIEQIASGGYKNWEYRAMDWKFEDKEDGAYGAIRHRSRFADPAEIGNAFLRNGFSGEVINTYSESTAMKGDQWHADQVWGIENVEGAPHYTRHIHFTRGNETHDIRKVYDFSPGA